jgi:hypothetical protein
MVGKVRGGLLNWRSGGDRCPIADHHPISSPLRDRHGQMYDSLCFIDLRCSTVAGSAWRSGFGHSSRSIATNWCNAVTTVRTRQTEPPEVPLCRVRARAGLVLLRDDDGIRTDTVRERRRHRSVRPAGEAQSGFDPDWAVHVHAVADDPANSRTQFEWYVGVLQQVACRSRGGRCPRTDSCVGRSTT